MKFCYLVPDLGITVDGQKGASSHIRGFVSALKSLGHEVALATPHPIEPGTIDVPIRLIPPPGLVEGILPDKHPRTFRALRHLFYNTSMERILQEMVADFAPDFIYERYSPFAFAGSYFAKQAKIPHILEVNAPLAEQGKRYRKQALQDASELLEITAFSHSSLLITLTNELKEWLVGLGINREKVAVRPCGVDVEIFCPEGPDYKDRYQEKIVLGFVGSLKPWHDIELLVKVFSRMASDHRYHLLVVGDGPMRGVVEALAEEFPGRVTITGAVPQDRVPAYIRTMDIALSPYPGLDLFYFSPLKVYEYMAMGKPIIATGIGQINTVIRHGINGFLVPPNHLEGWIESIHLLSEDSSLRDALGKKAREESVANHTWHKRAELFIELIERSFYGVEMVFKES